MVDIGEISREEALRAESRKATQVDGNSSMIKIHDCFKRIALALSEHQISNADATNQYYKLYHEATDRSANKYIWQAGISVTAGVIGGAAGVGGALAGGALSKEAGELIGKLGQPLSETVRSGNYLVQSGQTHNEAQKRMVESHHEGQKQRVSASDRTINTVTDMALSAIRKSGEDASKALGR